MWNRLPHWKCDREGEQTTSLNPPKHANQAPKAICLIYSFYNLYDVYFSLQLQLLLLLMLAIHFGAAYN